MDLHILSGGAAQGVVQALWPEFSAADGHELKGSFGAVGLMKEKFLAGISCDVLILTQALIEEMARDGQILADTVTPLGRVKTGIAVRRGEPAPKVASPEELRASLLAAKGIYFPDPQRATAGIHFANVLKQLGIYEQVAQALRPFPNGATAMQQLAQASGPGLIGCTQVTEILYTDKVQLVDVLPPEFELATVYTAAVTANAAQPELARRLVRLLGSRQTQALRQGSGFEA